MKHAFIMDPIENVKAYKDTTYFLMLAACQRGHEVYYINQTALRVAHTEVRARAKQLGVRADHDQPFEVHDERDLNLGSMDVVWIRTDPPFDRRYFYTTLLLDRLPSSARVVNRPSGLRNWNEKLAALNYPALTPETLISRNMDEILGFTANHDRVIIKPIDGHGGKGIEFIKAGDSMAREVISQVSNGGSQWIIAQQYLPEADFGDKRILLKDGEPLGAILRLHAEGVELNNLDAGGSANEATMTERDFEICRAVGPGLREQGIYFSGIDVIGGMLIEINVTSPTGLQELCRFNGRSFHHDLIAGLE